MKLIELLVPLLGVFLGALITGIGAAWKARAQRKRLIACALADLLEVRHHFLAFEVTVRELKRRFDMPAELAPVLRAFAQKMLPLEPDTHTRYSAAVSVLAGLDPVLAFKMRSKDKAPQLLGMLAEWSKSTGVAPAEVENLTSVLQELVIPSLDEAVVELASHHSWSTKRKVKRVVAKTAETPAELIALLEQVKSASEKPAS